MPVIRCSGRALPHLSDCTQAKVNLYRLAAFFTWTAFAHTSIWPVNNLQHRAVTLASPFLLPQFSTTNIVPHEGTSDVPKF